MSHPDWFAIIVCSLLGALVAGVKLACDKLDRIIGLLEIANRRND